MTLFPIRRTADLTVNRMRSIIVLTKVFVLMICAFLIAGAADAQTAKKKKKHATRKPAVKTVQQTGDASIVSQADQYQDSSTQIIQPTPSLADTQGLPDDTAKRLKDLQVADQKTREPAGYRQKGNLRRASKTSADQSGYSYQS